MVWQAIRDWADSQNTADVSYDQASRLVVNKGYGVEVEFLIEFVILLIDCFVFYSSGIPCLPWWICCAGCLGSWWRAQHHICGLTLFFQWRIIAIHKKFKECCKLNNIQLAYTLGTCSNLDKKLDKTSVFFNLLNNREVSKN